MRKLTLFCILIFCLFPRGVFADEAPTMSVVINEIAWMGTPSDDNDEWIELYNTTNEDIDLNGWSLKSADGIPSIEFTNGEVIKANDYFLLERTDDTAVSVKANKIYTGALSNSNPAEYLVLRDDKGILIDEVDASGGWFAGSNTPNPRISMERINPNVSGSEVSNWGNNNGITTNGLDKNNIELSATPLAQNSIYEEGDITSPIATASLTDENPYFSIQKLTFTTNEAATIYYAFGENPSEEDFIAYADEEILIEATTVVNFYAVDLAGNKEIPQTFTITINITYDTAGEGEILINEVVWMGSSNSTDDEWIELYNTTNKTFDLTNWKIRDELNSEWEVVFGDKLLSSKAYFLLERTDNTTTPAAEDMIFTGGISNDGGILVLQDKVGNEIDRVDGSNEWAIGGDRETKQTLARVDKNTFRSSKEVNGSPKAQNFFDNDLAITSLAASSLDPLPGEDVIFTATIENTGLNLQTSFTLHWLVDGEETNETIDTSIESFTSLEINSPQSFPSFTEGKHTISVTVELAGDGYLYNNAVTQPISLNVENHLLINEFIPKPKGNLT
ncbi:MAG: lamin tail domain-containing protein, partial [Candidatus Gracilibacteria bacterium]